ncbi:MAG: hypothetical protein ABEH35_03685 [Haloarculaceae archaeon]
MALSELWAVEMLLVAFAGGAFGAAVGALPSFAFCGVLVIVGELYALAHRTIGGTIPPVDVTGSVAFGPLGPHIAFAGGAAAVAYAARQDYLDTGFAYHPAKEVTRGLGSRADLLAVGGAFGVVGYWIATVSSALSLPVDPIALGVVGSAFAHRIALGYSLVGSPSGRWLDMAQSGPGADGESVSADGGRAVEPWLPYQYRWRNVTALGFVVGVLSAYLAYLTGSPFLAFGLAVAVLLLLNAGVAAIPVTHHMALPASTAALALANAPAAGLSPSAVAQAVPLGTALLVGGAFGLVGGLAGELLQRLLYAHAETHLDPPAASIVVTSLCIAVLAMMGVFPSAVWIPLP